MGKKSGGKHGAHEDRGGRRSSRKTSGPAVSEAAERNLGTLVHKRVKPGVSEDQTFDPGIGETIRVRVTKTEHNCNVQIVCDGSVKGQMSFPLGSVPAERHLSSSGCIRCTAEQVRELIKRTRGELRRAITDWLNQPERAFRESLTPVMPNYGRARRATRSPSGELVEA